MGRQELLVGFTALGRDGQRGQADRSRSLREGLEFPQGRPDPGNRPCPWCHRMALSLFDVVIFDNRMQRRPVHVFWDDWRQSFALPFAGAAVSEAGAL